MSDSKAETKLKPPFGAVSWYDDFLQLMQRRKIDRVDKELLITNEVVPESNVNSVINGLRFLGLINDDGSTTETMKSLGVVGIEYQANLAKMIHSSYAVLFSKLHLEQSLANDVINCFRVDYGLAPSTAGQSASIFVSLARKAGIELSPSILEALGRGSERQKPNEKPGTKTQRGRKGEPDTKSAGEPLPDEVLARLQLKGTGYVDIKDKDDLEIAKAYWNLLLKKLGST